MVKDEKDGGSNPFITKAFCDERFQRSLDQSLHLEKKIDDAVVTLKGEIQRIKSEEEEKSQFWRNLLGTIVGGGLVAFIAYLLTRVHF